MSSQPPGANKRLLLYAPNVHTGGGFVLLKALLESWPSTQPLFAWLDERARDSLGLRPDATIFWVSPSVKSRLAAEFSIRREGMPADSLLCFHGLPPLLKQRAKIILFQQNRNYLGNLPLSNFSWKTRQRLRYEQLISRLLRHRVTTYWVQTPSMRRNLIEWFGAGSVDVKVLPFALEIRDSQHLSKEGLEFLYVADGEAHKNHSRLVEAWRLLAEQGFRPELALTLAKRDSRLREEILRTSRDYDLRITDLGQLPHAEILSLYASARALIFPSLSESFGLPLVEASRMGVPIIASELDFVRDVCSPTETFDPKSPVSIARSVRRFLGHPETHLVPQSPSDFLTALFESPS